MIPRQSDRTVVSTEINKTGGNIFNLNIVTSPNQYIITISPKDKPKDEPYGLITRKAELIAGRLLNDRSASHILYYYFALNQDNYKFALSCSEVCRRYRISEKQYRAAIKKLKEAGYLVSDKNIKNGLIFLHIPKAYKNFEILEEEQADEQHQSKVFTPANNLPLKVSTPTPKGIDNLSLKGERNNKEILNNNIYNIIISSHEDSLSDENMHLVCQLKEDFGHLDNFQNYLDDTISKHKDNDYSLKHSLKDLYNRYMNNRRARMNNWKRSYKLALDKTLPERIPEQQKVRAILDKYISEHKEFFGLKHIADNFGIWINGWDNERQEPKIIIAFYPLPLSLLKKQKHNIDGIPKEYYQK